jgi:hypothetical protein
MRRRKVRTIREEERPTLLLMAAGAVAGAAAGLYLGQRYRSMDAFLADMRHRLEGLKEIWYEEDLPSGRRERIGVDLLDDEDDDVDESDEDYDDLEDDDLAPYAAEPFDDEEEDEEDEDVLDDEMDDEDEFEDELAAVANDNGISESALRAEEKARRLEERVLVALRNEPVLGARSIELAVVGDGVVELTGSVNAIEEVSRAAALVRGVPGVSMVLNRVEVRAGGSMDTASVARDPKTPAADDRL